MSAQARSHPRLTGCSHAYHHGARRNYAKISAALHSSFCWIWRGRNCADCRDTDVDQASPCSAISQGEPDRWRQSTLPTHRSTKPTRRLTAAESKLLKRRLTQLCKKGIPGPEITKRLNREFELNRNLGSYWRLAKYHLHFEWPRAVRVGRPGHRATSPELPPENERHCKHCGKLRVAVLYQVLSKGGQAFLCENKCCPGCGGKLEVHEVRNKTTGVVEAHFWAHALPLPARNCKVCDKEFTPKNIKQAHQQNCARDHTQIFS